MTPEAQKRASAKYNKKNTITILIRLNIKTDGDIINWIKKQPNKTGKIKNLIRKEIGSAS